MICSSPGYLTEIKNFVVNAEKNEPDWKILLKNEISHDQAAPDQIKYILNEAVYLLLRRVSIFTISIIIPG